jgi:molybdate transport system substrate-binding protein
MRRFQTLLSQVVIAGLAASTMAAQAPRRPALSIAAASDLQAVFPEITSRFERETGVKASVSFGSSGNFVAQIQNGAPFDLFFSADIDYPRQLIAAGFADKDSLFQYATGRLVVWTRNDSGIDISRGLSALEDPRVRRVAIANPQHAPYGHAALAALMNAGVYEAVRPKLVLGENISQTAQLADSGNAQVGILALSLAVSPALMRSGTYAEIPEGAHQPLEQAAVVMSGSRNKPTAQAFLAFLGQPDLRQLLQRFGFAVPLVRSP